MMQRRKGSEVAWRMNRKRLRRHDGAIYLDRWGLDVRRLGGVFIHKMSAPDPGWDLHNHPWAFASLVLKGGYVEERALLQRAPGLALEAEQLGRRSRGLASIRRRWSWRVLRLDECHRITKILGGTCWTLVFHGPYRHDWGFVLPTGWISEGEYDDTVRVDRRDLWDDDLSESPVTPNR